MDIARARSPPSTLSRRPIGPRNPGRPGTGPVKSIIPLDLTARLHDSPEIPQTCHPPASYPGLAHPRLPALSPDPTTQPTAMFASAPPPHVLVPHTQPANPDSPTLALSPSTGPPPSFAAEPPPAQGPSPPAQPTHSYPPDIKAPIPQEPPAPAPSPLADATNGTNGTMHALNGSNGSTYALNGSNGSAVSQGSMVYSERSGTPVSTPSKRSPLPAPPALNFESEPIQWKSMTLEAAQWTFTSEQLQEISAAESFIHVISTQTSDVELPQELERLEQLKLTTQAQYRFSMHRRTNLLQSLVALSQSHLTIQIADLTTACDRLSETLVRIADQKAQIQHIVDVHVSSALAMALRKLNASYAKRSGELQELRLRNEELQAELEEAWNMAQDMAQEMDDLDNFDLAFDEDEFDEEGATPDMELDDDDGPNNSALEADIYSDLDRMSGSGSVHSARVVGIVGTAVATKATLTSVANGDLKSGDRTSRVSAAKKRSSRTSKASLRVPKTPAQGNGEQRQRPDRSSVYSIHARRRSRSKSLRRAERGEGSSKDVPDVPIIRLPEPSRSREGSILDSNARASSPSGVSHGHSRNDSEAPPPPPPKSDLDAGMSLNSAACTFGSIPMINIPEGSDYSLELHPQPQQPAQKGTRMKPSAWRGRNFFARRVQSMQPPPLHNGEEIQEPGDLKRSASESKQFDGWPFGGSGSGGGSTTKQRFSVPGLNAMQPLRGRMSSDSAPAT
ncbi:uncharacterized protein BXZ73DRAFT_88483 [Epithele typhae]|uniref:uncharacterized protein n=1 Tax=Epithele typhae TaxID=378194 RepID=UPI00200809FD|nr:uncharacterized protein BXZ73DRAFT_88483 [Epithele typhae]KAH9940754.1 hypothetical protein BXZ73DRAFT_88483 [Epithele typhae]